jgi:hypothetical protein
VPWGKDSQPVAAEAGTVARVMPVVAGPGAGKAVLAATVIDGTGTADYPQQRQRPWWAWVPTACVQATEDRQPYWSGPDAGHGPGLPLALVPMVLWCRPWRLVPAAWCPQVGAVRRPPCLPAPAGPCLP